MYFIFHLSTKGTFSFCNRFVAVPSNFYFNGNIPNLNWINYDLSRLLIPVSTYFSSPSYVISITLNLSHVTKP